MKTLKSTISVIALAFVMLMSFNMKAQSDEDVAYAQQEFKKGMVSFVETLHPYYDKGMSYSSFKATLVGGSNAKGMTKEGNALLQKAYKYLSNGVSSASILKQESGVEIGNAFVFVKKYNYKNKSENGDLVLFGNTNGDTFPTNSVFGETEYKKCKWYQIGCHLSNLWDWLNDTNGSGQTNFDTIIRWLNILRNL